MPHAADTLDAHRQLEVLQPYLLKIARLQLRNDAWAEDVVSDTTLTALEKLSTFDGRSQLKTWVVAILRNKIVDFVRRSRREVALCDSDETDEDEIETLIFNARGGFRQRPEPWPDPESAMAERQFLAILEACVERLPAQLGRVFLMREWLELDAAEICRDLGVSTSNLWVMLHRARLRLRECIQVHWLGQPSGPRGAS